VPYRGKRNEPAWVPLTLARLARARNADPGELASATMENARRLFGLAASCPPG
jgi:TatD DNase family protein